MFYIASAATVGLNIGILQGSIPIFILMGSFFLYRQAANLRQIIGIVVTMIGVVTVVAKGSLSVLTAFQFNTGDLIMIAACAIYAIYTVKLREKPKASAMGFFSMLAIAAFVTSLPLVTYEYLSGNLIWPTTQGWLVVVVATLLPSLVAQVFFIKGVEIVGAARAGVFVNLVPIFGAIFVVVVLKESIEIYHVLSLAFVFLGIWISERSKNRNPLEAV